MAHEPLILASASPRRKQLLEMLYPRFEIIPSGVDEPGPEGQGPAAYAEELARLKALDVARQHPSRLVIGSDTIVVLDDHILGKPTDAADARRMLGSLSGRTHTVISAVSLLRCDQSQRVTDETTFHVATEVTFMELSEVEIANYVQTGSPLDKAGAYGIQDDLGALFVSHINGDYYNVVGFPLHRFYVVMKQFAPQHLPEALG